MITTCTRSTGFISRTLASKPLFSVIGIVLFLIIFGSFSPHAFAGIREKQDISKMVQKADLIIRGKVLSAESQWKEDSRGRHIYTSVNLNITDKIKGDINDNTLAFEVVGGTVGDIIEVVSGTPEFKTDEDTIVFLKGQPLTIRQGIGGKIPILNGRVYGHNSRLTAGSFIQDLKILEKNPDAPVFDEKTSESIIEMTAAASQCYLYDGYKWPTSSVSYKINENTYDCTGEGAAVQAAANTWNNIGVNFAFQYTGTHYNTYSSQNYVNEIMWGTPSQPAVALTTYWAYTTGEIIECDIVFDDSYNWSSTTPNSSQMDVQTVALHELGHWLNLKDLYNSGDSSNIMYGYVSNGQVKRVLQPCDISGICYIYGCTQTYTLSVNSSGASGVSISSSTGHGGTTNYTKNITSGTTVSLTAPATAANGSIFTGWTGDITSSSQTISFSMSIAKNVTANYVTTNYTLSVNSSGVSGVSISSNTGHGGTTNYTKTVTSGTNVTLTAPSTVSGKNFTGWTGSVTSGSQTISFTMDGNKTIMANYVTPSYTLSVNSSGSSGVSISSSSGHGGTTNYTKSITSGTSVNLCVSLYIGSCSSRMRFTGWTGSVSDTSLCIMFPMDGNKTVTANYVADPETYTLTVNSSGTSGVIISSSTGHGGTTNYTKTLNCGTAVTLTAPSTANRKFLTGWTGDVTDSNETISFTMNGNKNVTVNFSSPGAPVLHLEPNTMPGLCNMLLWDSIPLAKSYYAECASDPCFLNIDYHSGWITNTSYQFCGITGCLEWFRVKSSLSGWSQTSQAEFQSDTLADAEAAGGGDVVLAGNSTRTVDTVGSTAYYSDTTDSYLNGLFVTTATTLAQIEVYLNISASVSIEFVVYEGGTSFSDQYNQIHSSTLAISGTGAKFYSSGQISVPLQKGRYYMIGAVYNGLVIMYYDESAGSTSFADHSGWGFCNVFPSPQILTDFGAGNITFYHRYTAGQDSSGHRSPGSVVSAPVTLPSGGTWGIVDFNLTTPPDTELTVDVLPAVGSTPIAGYENVPSGADLSGISNTTIRLRANLSTNEPNSTPALHDWSVTYGDPAGIESDWSNVEISGHIIPGDFEPDCDVDMDDLIVFTEQWLLKKLSADVWPNGGDRVIDLMDFAVFANAWQSTPAFPKWNPKCDIVSQGGDGIVDISDLAVLTGEWLQFGAYSADIAPLSNGNGTVDSLDFAEFALHWLEGI
jgi:hypothetical protein